VSVSSLTMPYSYHVCYSRGVRPARRGVAKPQAVLQDLSSCVLRPVVFAVVLV